MGSESQGCRQGFAQRPRRARLGLPAAAAGPREGMLGHRELSFRPNFSLCFSLPSSEKRR